MSRTQLESFLTAGTNRHVVSFHNDYDDLRTIEPAVGGSLPLRWGNLMNAHTQGVDFWANIQRVSKPLELALNGFNLLDDAHTEYALPTAPEIRRSVYAKARWTF